MSSGTIYDFSAFRNDGKEQSLSDFRGKVILIVNVASHCGFTPQYEGLETLYRKYSSKGFEILAFPCDQFANQEPGTDEEIKSFCELNYGVSFPLFKKIEVNGENAHPLYVFLKQQAPGFLNEAIKWNFTKFLVDREGKVVDRFAPATKPVKLTEDIEKRLT